MERPWIYCQDGSLGVERRCLLGASLPRYEVGPRFATLSVRPKEVIEAASKLPPPPKVVRQYFRSMINSSPNVDLSPLELKEEVEKRACEHISKMMEQLERLYGRQSMNRLGARCFQSQLLKESVHEYCLMHLSEKKVATVSAVVLK